MPQSYHMHRYIIKKNIVNSKGIIVFKSIPRIRPEEFRAEKLDQKKQMDSSTVEV